MVVVLGPATAMVASALWSAGLRPLRGSKVAGSLWATPARPSPGGADGAPL
jgi:hypothetical protein